jgi:hypothetical protein
MTPSASSSCLCNRFFSEDFVGLFVIETRATYRRGELNVCGKENLFFYHANKSCEGG